MSFTKKNVEDEFCSQSVLSRNWGCFFDRCFLLISHYLPTSPYGRQNGHQRNASSRLEDIIVFSPIASESCCVLLNFKPVTEYYFTTLN
jgi:hypothetical protein